MTLELKLLREIFEFSQEALLIYDKDFNLINGNKSAIDTFKVKNLDELLDTNIFSQEVLNNVKNASSKEITFETSYNSDAAQISLLCKTLKLSDGVTLLHVTDIAKQEKSEAELIEIANRFKIFTENTQDVFWILSERQKLLYVSPSVTKLRGYTVEEALNQSIQEMILPTSWDSIKGMFFEVLERIRRGERDIPSQLIEVEQPCKDGSTVWTEMVVNAIFSGTGEFLYFSGISRNISQRKKDIQARVETEKKFNDIVELLPEIVYEIDTSNKFTYINKTGLTKLNISSEDLSKGIYIDDVIAPQDLERAHENLKKMFEGKKIPKAEYRIVDKKGESYIVEAFYAPILKGDKVTSIQGIAVDITDRKKFEYQLIKAKQKAEESDKLKSSFLANMSHEIRTPMNSILGFSQLLQTPDIEEEKKNQYLRIINSNSQVLMNLINDIIDISKIESGQIQVVEKEVNLNVFIQDIYTVGSLNLKCHNRTEVELIYSTDLPDEKSGVITDDIKLKQVLTNLLTNAIKFTKRGKIEFGYKLKDKELCFYVNDTGIGLPEDKKNIIFERFTQIDPGITREFGGAGLGLSICQGLVRLLGGKIWVDSVYGEGSKFQFVIPYKPSKSDDIMKEKESIDTSELLNNKKILIVEDDFASFIFLEELFVESNAKILHAENGDEAVQMYKDNPDIDCILMDIQLPSLSGIEVTEYIRKQNKTVPIIAQTAFAMTEDRKKALQAGCDDYVTKPIDPDILMKKMANLLKK